MLKDKVKPTIIKVKCTGCGRLIMKEAREKNHYFHCATCTTLGVKKSLGQLQMVKSSGAKNLEIKPNDE